MKRLGLVTMSVVFSGCVVRGPGVWIPPPRAQVVVDAPPPPPPPAVAVDTQPATVQLQVDAAPEVTVEPEEVIATSEPPELVYEEQDDMPSPGMVWIGGYWHWTGSEWAWFYGRWNTAPEGRVYVDPYYEHVNGHVVYVAGYWGARGEEPRYYGGDRIVLARPARPEGYRRGEHPPIARSAGLPPGHRAGHYGPKPAGPVKRRPLPTATAPRKPVPRAESGHTEPGHAEPGHAEPGHAEPGHAEPGHAEPGHAEPGHAEPGHAEPGHAEPGHPVASHNEPEPGAKQEARPASPRPEPRPETRPETRPAPKPEPRAAAKSSTKPPKK